MESNRQEFYPIVHFLWVKFRWRTYVLVTSGILGLFVNTMTADGKYFCYKTEMFTQAIQMQLFEKPKIFYQFFIAFLESTWNFQHFEKAIKHSSTMSAILDSERSCYLNVLNAMFWTPLGVYNFLLYFCNLHQILNILKRSIKLIPQLYRILFTPKDLVT